MAGKAFPKGLGQATKSLEQQLQSALAGKGKGAGAARKRLTPRQERFVNALVANAPSAAEAARQAGYSDTAEGAKVTACRNLTNPNVLTELERRQKLARDRSVRTREAHIARMERLADLAEQLGQVAVAVRAEELSGRVQGFYVERTENVNLEIARLSPDQLNALMVQVAQRLQALASVDVTQDTPSDTSSDGWSADSTA